MRSVAGCTAMAVDVVGSEDIIRDCESLSHRRPGTGNCEDQKKRHLVHTSRTSSCMTSCNNCVSTSALLQMPDGAWRPFFPPAAYDHRRGRLSVEGQKIKVSTPGLSAPG